MNSTILESKTLNNFTSLSDGNLEQIDGGIFPIVIGGVVISKAAVGWGAAAIGAGALTGYLVNRKW